MKIDPDIQKLLIKIEMGHHTIERAIDYFLRSLPGYNNTYHQKATVDSYRRCLRTDKNNFLKFVQKEGLKITKELKVDTLEFYKIFIINRVDRQTSRKYITAVKQFILFCSKIGWIKDNIGVNLHLPRVPHKSEIETIPKEVLEEILKGEWGKNNFTIKRNNLIVHLFSNCGMRPKEISGILIQRDIHPYLDLAYITVTGKRGATRDVMLDEPTFQALKEYAKERAKFVKVKKIWDDHLILSLIPKKGKYSTEISGIQAVIRRIKNKLLEEGCVWNVKNLNPQGFRRTAVSTAFELAEHLPIHHPELSIPGQFGHSLQIAEKHYWKKSKRNAYILAKGKNMNIINHQNNIFKDPENTLHNPFNNLFGGPI